MRAEQIAMTRESKLSAVEQFVSNRNDYLAKHSKASTAVALKKVDAKIAKLKCDVWLRATVTKENEIALEKNEIALDQAALLDGCITGWVLRHQVGCSERPGGSTNFTRSVLRS
jgi:hypothetical protein